MANSLLKAPVHMAPGERVLLAQLPYEEGLRRDVWQPPKAHAVQ